ncbi:MAG TPA: Dickkopf N-terminal cysteine-rich domain-containing protein [Patescibacteria group bacterium]|nr:Dickkopf N-terminal cysteine-rich domain-containing protein [Patescibacteria group bacterium]
MPVGGLIKKGVSSVGREYLSKINLALLIALIILTLSLYYYPNPNKETCQQNINSNTYNSISQNLGNREIIITNATTANNDCYLTYVCVNRTQECPNLCVNNGLTCSDNSQCCSGCCKSFGTAGSMCLSSEQCTSACTQISGLCTNSSQCCSGLICQGATCQPALNSCKSLNQTCSVDSDCCSGLLCHNGICDMPVIAPACKNISQICSSSTDCCSGLTCRGSTCQP